ncbi:MAG: ImmA/IrrE family metallo-endopeptidase [Chloroflexi bacterium]|nr:ImmA/IrrE family metallo-endopeptidase [Chloroflexota bacterium]
MAMTSAAQALCRLADRDQPIAAIEALVDQLLDLAEAGRPPVPLEVVASFRGVREISIAELPRSGQLQRESGHYIVVVNADDSAARRRFTIAHEICHTFFHEARRVIATNPPEWTGRYDRRSDEEYLCDVGAGRMLLHPSWLQPKLASQTPSLDALLEISDQAGASLEATAFQASQMRVWYATFVFWEPGYRKAELTLLDQAVLPGFDEQELKPRHKLRARRIYAHPDAPFLAVNMSIDTDTGIGRAWTDRTTTQGIELLPTSGHGHQAACQSMFAPFRAQDGQLRDRVLTCIAWR